MTIIAAAFDKTNKRMYIGADSLVSNGINFNKINKLITITPNLIIGFSGYLRLRDMIIERRNYYQNYILERDIFELIRDDWIDLKDKDNDSLLLGISKNKIYTMYSNHQIEEFTTENFIGSGENMARAVYYNNYKLLKKPVKESLELALKTTCVINRTCAGPIKIMELK